MTHAQNINFVSRSLKTSKMEFLVSIYVWFEKKSNRVNLDLKQSILIFLNDNERHKLIILDQNESVSMNRMKYCEVNFIFNPRGNVIVPLTPGKKRQIFWYKL